MLYGVMMTRVCFVLCAAAPHNCIGGSEMNCLPGAAEAATMFADPSKMQNTSGEFYRFVFVCMDTYESM